MGLFVFINSGLFVVFWTRNPSLQLFITENYSLILLQLLCVSREHSQFDTETLCFERTPPMFLWLPRNPLCVRPCTGSSILWAGTEAQAPQLSSATWSWQKHYTALRTPQPPKGGQLRQKCLLAIE